MPAGSHRPSFRRSAQECRPRLSAASALPDPIQTTWNVPKSIPTRNVGMSSNGPHPIVLRREDGGVQRGCQNQTRVQVSSLMPVRSKGLAPLHTIVPQRPAHASILIIQSVKDPCRFRNCWEDGSYSPVVFNIAVLANLPPPRSSSQRESASALVRTLPARHHQPFRGLGCDIPIGKPSLLASRP